MSQDETGLIDRIAVDHAIGLYRAKVDAMNGAPSSDAMFDLAALAVNIVPVLIDEIENLRQDLSAKTSDFDAALRKISALRDEVADFQAACKSACEQRDAALEQLAAVRTLATNWATQWAAANPLLASAGTQWQIQDGREILAILDGPAVRDGE